MKIEVLYVCFQAPIMILAMLNYMYWSFWMHGNLERV